MSVAVVIGTYGDQDKWGRLADNAASSAEAQTLVPDDTIQVHSDTLAKARNVGAGHTRADWLIFLDADDTLDCHYVEAMMQAVDDRTTAAELGVYTDRTLFQPATVGVHADRIEDPWMIQPAENLLTRNHMVIGTMISHSLFDEVGGFHEYPIYEDWELWLRCWIFGGATWTQVPDAHYMVTVRTDGRNNQEGWIQQKYYSEIRGLMEPEARARGLL